MEWLCYSNIFGGQRHGFRTFRGYLLVASQSLTLLSCAYNFFRLISVLQICFKLSKCWLRGGTKLSLKYSMDMLLTCTPYYDGGSGCLIRTELLSSTFLVLANSSNRANQIAGPGVII